MDNQCTCNIIYLFQLKRNCSHRSPKVLEEWPIHLASVRGLRKWTLQVLKMWGQTWRIWDAKFRSASTKSTENCDYLVGWWSLRSTPRTQFNSRIKKVFPDSLSTKDQSWKGWVSKLVKKFFSSELVLRDFTWTVVVREDTKKSLTRFSLITHYNVGRDAPLSLW